MKKSLLLFVVSLLVIVGLVGCSSESSTDSSATKAKVKESLVVYTGRNLELVEPLIEQFEKDTGINVELRDGESAELATQIATEGKASKADIFFSQDAGALGLLDSKDLLSDIPDGITKDVNERFKSKDDTWVGVSGRARVLVYNTDLATDFPKTLDEMVSSEYKGKIGFAPTNASFQSFVTALRVDLGEEGAKSWLKEFAANEPKVYEKNSAIVKAVNDGQIPMGLVNHYYLLELTNEIGADKINSKNYFFKDDSAGSLVNVAGLGILKSSKNQEVSQKFVKYLISEKGQKYFVNKTFEYPVVSSIKAPDGLPALDEISKFDIDLTELESLDKTIKLLDEVGLLTK